MPDNTTILPQSSNEINPQPINILKFFKIWFGPMPEKIQQRLISIKQHSPQANISLLWAPAYLKKEYKILIENFAKMYEIALVDISNITAIDLIEEILLALVHLELIHWANYHEQGNLAAASDILRLLQNCYQYGYYTDCDVTLKSSDINNLILPSQKDIVFNYRNNRFNNDIIAGNPQHPIMKYYAIAVVKSYLSYIESFFSKIENLNFSLITLQLKLFLTTPNEQTLSLLLSNFKKTLFFDEIAQLKTQESLFEERNKAKVYHVLTMSGPICLKTTLSHLSQMDYQAIKEKSTQFQSFFTCENDLSWDSDIKKLRENSIFSQKEKATLKETTDSSLAIKTI